MVHLITYELKGYRPAYAYQRIAEEIKQISGTWCHIPESKWLIETQLATRTVAERIAPMTLRGDTIFVTRIYSDWSAYSLTDEQLAWLSNRNFYSTWEMIQSVLPIPSLGKAPIGALSKALGFKK